MNRFYQAWSRFCALFKRRQWEKDMAEELRLHLEQRTEEGIAAGLSPEEARFAAQREFGGLEQIKELAREANRMVWVEHLGQDLRFGARMLRKQPGFTTVAVLTLALGIGATTAIFSVVNGVLLRPLGYHRSGEIVLLAEISPQLPGGGVSPGAYLGWHEHATSFASLAAWTYGPYNLTGSGEPRRLYAQRVTTGYFGVLGVRPALGRDFTAAEEIAGQDNVVILSHHVWLDQFHGEKSVVGSTIVLDERPFVVAGVMPEDFGFDRRADIYTPQVLMDKDRENFSQRNLLVLGRLKPGVSVATASDEMTGLTRRIAKQSPATQRNWGVKVLPILDAMVGGVRPLLLILLGAVGFLLLIACMNVANLLLARGSTRQREMAVRFALGAGRGRIIRQLLSESLLIAALGGVMGILVGYGGMHLLLTFLPEGLPRVEEVAMDGTVLAFACVLALGTGLGFGLVPAFESTGVDAVETLKDSGHGISEGRRSRRLRSLLVVLEIGVALILLTGAGLLARSFVRLQQVEPGFVVRGNYMTNIILSPRKYPTEAARTAFVEETMAGMKRVAGVTAVAFTNHTLPTMGMGRTFFTIAGRAAGPVDLPPAYYYAVTPEFFSIFGIALVRGRLFTPADAADTPRVILINRKMAALHFPDSDPLGQKISVGNGPESWREIVGIVGDTHQNGPAEPVRAQVYEPYAQNPSATTTVVIRSTLTTAEVTVAAATTVHALDPGIPLTQLYPLDNGLPRALVPMRFVTLLFSVFAVTALALATIGVYGVMSYTVSRRTGEIGLRMALGAQRRDVLWLIFRQGGRMVAAGLLLGLAGAVAITHLLAWLLFEVSPYDPVTLVANMALLAAAAFVACWLPARRATKVEPMVALRCE